MSHVVPRAGEKVTSDWTVGVPKHWDDPDPMGEERPPPSRPSPTQSHGDSTMDGAPPTRRARATSHLDNDLAEDAAAPSDRFHIALHTERPTAEPLSSGSAPAAADGTCHNAVQGGPANEASSLIGVPKFSSARPTSEIVPPRHVFARGPNGPVCFHLRLMAQNGPLNATVACWMRGVRGYLLLRVPLLAPGRFFRARWKMVDTRGELEFV